MAVTEWTARAAAWVRWIPIVPPRGAKGLVGPMARMDKMGEPEGTRRQCRFGWGSDRGPIRCFRWVYLRRGVRSYVWWIRREGRSPCTPQIHQIGRAHVGRAHV